MIVNGFPLTSVLYISSSKVNLESRPSISELSLIHIYTVHPGDRVFQGPGVLLVNRPIHGQHSFPVRGLALQGSHAAGLDYPVQGISVPEHRVLCQLEMCIRDRITTS